MPSERKRRRQFDLAISELVQFCGLPGIRAASAAEVRAEGDRAQDLWWTPDGKAYVSLGLSAAEILEALAPPVRPDWLEVRPGLEAGAFAVSVPGKPERTWEIEATEWGLRQLAGLVAARARPQGLPAAPPLGRWVPSEWQRAAGPIGSGKIPAGAKIIRLDERGHVRPQAIPAGLELD